MSGYNKNLFIVKGHCGEDEWILSQGSSWVTFKLIEDAIFYADMLNGYVAERNTDVLGKADSAWNESLHPLPVTYIAAEQLLLEIVRQDKT